MNIGSYEVNGTACLATLEPWSKEILMLSIACFKKYVTGISQKDEIKCRKC